MSCGAMQLAFVSKKLQRKNARPNKKAERLAVFCLSSRGKAAMYAAPPSVLQQAYSEAAEAASAFAAFLCDDLCAFLCDDLCAGAEAAAAAAGAASGAEACAKAADA